MAKLFATCKPQPDTPGVLPNRMLQLDGIAGLTHLIEWLFWLPSKVLLERTPAPPYPCPCCKG
jgi:hypothetical protein